MRLITKLFPTVNISGMKLLAHDLHYSFFTWPEIFQQVQPELALLQVALDTVKENLETTTIKDSLLFEFTSNFRAVISCYLNCKVSRIILKVLDLKLSEHGNARAGSWINSRAFEQDYSC